MGKILLARVDDRLIHGQVMTKWSKGMNTNALFVVDDATAADPFMKDIYMMSTSNTGMTIKVLSIDEAVDYWNKENYEDYRVILLFKTIGAVKDAIDKGLPIERLNLGGIAKGKDSKFVIPNVAVKPDELEVLKEIANKGIEVFFQVVPDTKAVSLKDAIKSY
ncbi:PTS system mannose/fructose/N-acetylgalactosamine-transporter subunit IIB [Tepidimicrobium xylanilyticum]|uniref:PTS system mannose/fructose/N-acetylgalactosamine-transporter subunit IIB n=1 Tax=Tepidimicrobium xylanilyticum TaxID=1123352 RepID=UPI002653B6FE|nr:PTS sugar transporter subunit IIB [Tepidimicrobium xylanilyticum]GMG97548.1 PTS sorbose transporter subunit IIB [Tepidimicrobium xylanilyticum]